MKLNSILGQIATGLIIIVMLVIPALVAIGLIWFAKFLDKTIGYDSIILVLISLLILYLIVKKLRDGLSGQSHKEKEGIIFEFYTKNKINSDVFPVLANCKINQIGFLKTYETKTKKDILVVDFCKVPDEKTIILLSQYIKIIPKDVEKQYLVTPPSYSVIDVIRHSEFELNNRDVSNKQIIKLVTDLQKISPLKFLVCNTDHQPNIALSFLASKI